MSAGTIHLSVASKGSNLLFKNSTAVTNAIKHFSLKLNTLFLFELLIYQIHVSFHHNLMTC